MIAAEGAGVIVVISRRTPDATTRSIHLRSDGIAPEALEMNGLRDYGVGAHILTELGVQDMILLTNRHHTLVGLSGYGLSIVGERLIDGVDPAERAGEHAPVDQQGNPQVSYRSDN